MLNHGFRFFQEELNCSIKVSESIRCDIEFRMQIPRGKVGRSVNFYLNIIGLYL